MPDQFPRSIVAVLLGALVLLGSGAATGNTGSQNLARAGKAPGIGFQLRKTKLSPKRPYFEGLRPIRIDYGFAAKRATDLRIRIISVRSGNTVRVYRERNARPGKRLQRRWNGLNRRGKAVGDGRYEFRVGPKGGRDLYAGRLRLHGHVFPIDGAHADRGAIGEFGAGRSGGRTHEGFDVNADCGTGLRAARAGKVIDSGYDSRLYGWFVRIGARKSSEQYFYAHLISRPEVGRGDRVRTGEPLGRIGRTGNAASTPCHLHFELRRGGALRDPKPYLHRWDRWS